MAGVGAVIPGGLFLVSPTTGFVTVLFITLFEFAFCWGVTAIGTEDGFKTDCGVGCIVVGCIVVGCRFGGGVYTGGGGGVYTGGVGGVCTGDVGGV